ncbi:MAG: 2,3-bisphosphoglycerate-dependent phosphoglycerate mutase [Actinomycetes bacterium]|nr:2,3-bisphosphoglycerate-dependent phosphoglycerate mutase [Actinomycetes bacterium]MDX5381034.1 2,3-bisphosphoglycerate-dependent phosphoglycerate mutase [Actinomycetes bacterium]MDX5400202.1 2,3-bisphosphoglycerate-dependent phosphoglycerate mutase [Actinomycetes bacterium]MDX5450788.1 2,3-bisphosphoglycerate-dependent phosphoglycerate mutase [Actinomycetes bacterium]
MPPGGTLVLRRHGESIFNATSTFTGLLDVGLTRDGERQVAIAANLMRAEGIVPDLVINSPMVRASRTTELLLGHLGMSVPVETTWRLAERDYGCLTGVSKAEAAARHGERAFFEWRRTLHGRPPAASPERRSSWVDPAPLADAGPLVAGAGESLHDVVVRVRPLWEEELHERLTDGQTVVVVAHGNSLRALCAVIDDLADTEIEDLNIPAGHPLAYDVDHLGHAHPRGGRYLDDDAATRAAAKVAAEGGT